MNLTGQQIPFANAQAARIMGQHGFGQSEAALRAASKRDAVGHSSVQPWSAGALFPGVITVVDQHHEETGEFECRRYVAQWKNEASQAFVTRGQAEAWIIGHQDRARAAQASPKAAA